MKKTITRMFVAIIVAGATGMVFAEKDFGDFYTRAWYMVVDNLCPAKSLSWRVFDVCGPAEHHNNVEKNPSFTIRRKLAVDGINPKPIPNPSAYVDWELKDTRFDDGVARKAVCGGSFNDRPHRALMRWGYPAWMRPFDVGFRIACDVR